MPSRLGLLCASAALAGCVGSIGDRSEGGLAPDDGSGPLACGSGAALDPGPTFLRRITNAEYRDSIGVLLGPGLDDPTAGFPPDPVQRGFSNGSESVSISALHVERYEQAAEGLALEVIADSGRRLDVVGCDLPAEGAACLDAFVRDFGRLAFRRTLGDDEVGSFVALAAAAAGDPDGWMPAALVIQAALQSPSFLFRPEVGAEEAASPARKKLLGHEVATRLSFFLLGRAPDAALLDAADAGALDTADGVRALAESMLDAGEAAGPMRRFASEWLQLPLLAGVQRDAAEYPAWSEALREAMHEETLRFTDRLFWDEGASMLDLVDAASSTVNADLAALYGLPTPASDWASVELPSERSGLLTHASVLTLTSRNEAATLIHRGKYVRDVLLCDPPPPPPPDVPPLMGDEGASAADQLAQHLGDPTCKGCHERLDPIGLGFARFDAIGGYRATDDDGAAIEQQGKVVGLPDPVFDGPVELASLLREAPEVPACFVQQSFRYAFGRGEKAADACTLDAVATSFAGAGHSFRELLLAFVGSDAFRYRSVKEPEEFQ